MPAISKHQYLTNAGWDDVPHLSEEDKAAVEAVTPKHLLPAAKYGLPVSSVGRIYPWDFDRICLDGVHPHLSWPRIYGFDPAVNRTAALWGALNEQDDTLYIYSEYFQTHHIPRLHAQAINTRGSWVPGMYDPAAEGKILDGRKMIQVYREAGLTSLRIADNAVRAGLDAVTDRITTGRLRFAGHLSRLRFEWNNYRRDALGKIIKDNDDLMDCFDAQTEVLTAEGWKSWPDVLERDNLATVDLATDTLEYQVPTELIQREHFGAMVHIDGKKVDLLVTPNHRMVVYPKSSPGLMKVKPACRLSTTDRLKLASRGWRGDQRTTVQVQGPNGKSATLDAHRWAELLGWYVAEGSVVAKVVMPGSGYGVFISQKDKSYLGQFLADTPWTWNYNGSSFYTSSKWLYEAVVPLGKKAWEKAVPQWVMNSDPETIEAFLRGAVAGDGWISRDNLRRYATTSMRLADQIQELFIKIGRSASVIYVPAREGGEIRGKQVHGKHDQWWVLERKMATAGLYRRSGTRTKKIFRLVPYEGMVYCATVPNGTLVVRRNGRPAIVGNCLRYICLGGLQYAAVNPEYVQSRSLNPYAAGGSEVADEVAGF